MAKINPERNEIEQSQLPALALLCKFGYTYLSATDLKAQRNNKDSHVLLEGILKQQLSTINTFTYKRKKRSFSEDNINKAIQTLKEVSPGHGRMKANERTYDLLTLGKSFNENIDGTSKSYSLNYIDWNNPERNLFHVTAEMSITRQGRNDSYRPDLVVFCNGIPLAVIECKARDHELDQAIEQMIRNQDAEAGIPELFKYAQVLVAAKANKASYATAGTPKKFWSLWPCHKSVDDLLADYLNRPLTTKTLDAIFSERCFDCNNYRKRFEERERSGRMLMEQDRALYQLLRPERLLELMRHFIIFEPTAKKIARYQQYRAVKEAMKRLLHPNEQGQRRGGVIGHTQGSGKSLTMVMLAQSIASERSIVNARFILVTDRKELDHQLKNTFSRCGIETVQATSGAHLRELIQSGRSIAISTVINKFNSALKQKNFKEDSGNVFIFVDESHRTQYGQLHPKMKRVFPNACYIGFTGTPLTRKEKNTFDKFGGAIDVYSMKQAVADKAVVPLLYEARLIEQDVHQKAIDSSFERYTRGLSDQQKADLKRKYSRADVLSKTEQRIERVAFDVNEHFSKHWQGTKCKAQLVAPDKKSAILYKKFLDEWGDLQSQVVISPPDQREGYKEVDESSDDIVISFWQQMMKTYGNEENYLKRIISDFKEGEQPEIIIVVSKLLTGFDAPRNTVLYLARQMRDHTLLQAIARVNRLHEEKEFGYIIDYNANLGNLDKALTEYAALADFEEGDIEGVLINIREEIEKMKQKHADLLDVFKSIDNKNDFEALEQHLAEEATRDEFYEQLRAFSKSLHIAQSSDKTHEIVDDQTMQGFIADFRKFQKLRASAALRYADRVDFKKIEPQIKKLLDRHISSEEVIKITPKPVNIFNNSEMETALAHFDSPSAKADMIAHAMLRQIEVDLKERDPVLYEKFSKMIRDAIDDFRSKAFSELEYSREINAIHDEYTSGRWNEVPSELECGEAALGAMYRVLKEWAGKIERLDERNIVQLTRAVWSAIKSGTRNVDWERKQNIRNAMLEKVEEAFSNLSHESKFDLDWDDVDELFEKLMKIAEKSFA